jgi:hypothetical protein
MAGMNATPDLTSAAHARRPEDVLAALGVSVGAGLSQADAIARLQAHGPNLLSRRRQAVASHILAHQFASPVVVLLAIAAAVSLAYGEVVEALAIGAVLVVNAAIGFVTEIRAVRSMEALRQLGTVTTRVRRDGRMMVLPAQGTPRSRKSGRWSSRAPPSRGAAALLSSSAPGWIPSLGGSRHWSRKRSRSALRWKDSSTAWPGI